ncbi:MAG: septum formation initiator family protein [Patescibacteria group bacterium]|nr:septum formation initiator family protein [Patescibacteria group bacterium]
MIAKSKTQRKKREEVVFQVIFFGLILFFVGLLLISNYRMTKKRAELREKVESLRQEIQILQQEGQNLEAGISQTQKDIYWEEKVREQGYVKEGENQVVVIGSEEEGNEEIKTQSFKGFLEKIKNFFGRIIKK